MCTVVRMNHEISFPGGDLIFICLEHIRYDVRSITTANEYARTSEAAESVMSNTYLILCKLG